MRLSTPPPKTPSLASHLPIHCLMLTHSGYFRKKSNKVASLGHTCLLVGLFGPSTVDIVSPDPRALRLGKRTTPLMKHLFLVSGKLTSSPFLHFSIPYFIPSVVVFPLTRILFLELVIGPSSLPAGAVRSSRAPGRVPDGDAADQK